MTYIDEVFKEVPPLETVSKIKSILTELGIQMKDQCVDIGVENSNIVRVMTDRSFPATAGKGVTKEFAMASGYAEFIERLQCGLMFYKYQCLEDDPKLNLHTYAPDAVYLSREELIENGEWMDAIIETYGSSLSREKIADQCVMYANSDRVLCLPFYSYFEDKSVLLPCGFVEHMYSANGCCAGNTKDEAWVHAISEMFERNATIYHLLHNDACSVISEDTLQSFPTVSNILSQIRADGHLSVTVFDFSRDFGIPVIATRVINLQTQDYLVNIGADPVLEIAIERTLTEIFQRGPIDTLCTYRPGKPIPISQREISTANNVLNQLELAKGLFSAAFFCENGKEKTKDDFPDYSQKTNTQLVEIMMEELKKTGKPVYIRNYSFLGFPCYKFVVPGFSESRGVRLTQPLQEYALGTIASRTLRNIEKATDEQLDALLIHRNMISDANSRAGNFSFLSGIPFEKCEISASLANLHYAYAAYKLHRYTEASQYLMITSKHLSDPAEKQYLKCFARYLDFLSKGCEGAKAKTVIEKLFPQDVTIKFFSALASGNPFGNRLVRCNPSQCNDCRYFDICHYSYAAELISLAGEKYQTFFGGQDPSCFK